MWQGLFVPPRGGNGTPRTSLHGTRAAGEPMHVLQTLQSAGTGPWRPSREDSPGAEPCPGGLTPQLPTRAMRWVITNKEQTVASPRSRQQTLGAPVWEVPEETHVREGYQGPKDSWYHAASTHVTPLPASPNAGGGGGRPPAVYRPPPPPGGRSAAGTRLTNSGLHVACGQPVCAIAAAWMDPGQMLGGPQRQEDPRGWSDAETASQERRQRMGRPGDQGRGHRA